MRITIHYHRYETFREEVKTITNRVIIALRCDILYLANNERGKYFWNLLRKKSTLTDFYPEEEILTTLDDGISYDRSLQTAFVENDKFRNRLLNHYPKTCNAVEQYVNAVYFQETLLNKIDTARSVQAGSIILEDYELEMFSQYQEMS